MTNVSAEELMPIVSRLNSITLRKEQWKRHLTPESRTTGWCGLPPVSEGDIREAEIRLGATLPPSYRAFLSISNGWYPFSSFIERLLPLERIKRYRTADPEDLALLQECYQEDNVSDEEYLDYETPEHVVALRHRYYPDSILIGKRWDGGGGELLLLNPHIVSTDDEWEVIFFANWIPGNRRFRSFRSFLEDSVNTLEASEASLSQ